MSNLFFFLLLFFFTGINGDKINDLLYEAEKPNFYLSDYNSRILGVSSKCMAFVGVKNMNEWQWNAVQPMEAFNGWCVSRDHPNATVFQGMPG